MYRIISPMSHFVLDYDPQRLDSAPLDGSSSEICPSLCARLHRCVPRQSLMRLTRWLRCEERRRERISHFDRSGTGRCR
jgi:hypothetical protein